MQQRTTTVTGELAGSLSVPVHAGELTGVNWSYWCRKIVSVKEMWAYRTKAWYLLTPALISRGIDNVIYLCRCLVRFAFFDLSSPVKCGQTIRLTHVNTGRNLHSHHFQSPLSHNLEVSAFGENGAGDDGKHYNLGPQSYTQWGMLNSEFT